MREARRAFSAHCSRDAAAITDLSEQPETPGPQPRQGSKAAAVPVMEKMEFSSKSPGFRPEVSARVVESGRSSPEAAELAELLAEPGASELLAVEPPQPARMLQASAAQSSSERMRAYLNFIVVSSLSGAAAGPQHFKTIHPKYTFCRGGCQSDSAERISSGKYAHCTKKKRIFGNFAFLTFFAKIG